MHSSAYFALFPHLVAQSDTGAARIGNAIGGVFGIVALIVAALWIIFPFMVYSKFGSLERLQRKQIDLLEKIARNGKDGLAGKNASSVGYSAKSE